MADQRRRDEMHAQSLAEKTESRRKRRADCKAAEAAAAQLAADEAKAAAEAEAIRKVDEARLALEAAEALAAKKRRIKDIEAKLRRSTVRCTCKRPFHTERCRIRGTRGQILWLGYDVGVTRADMQFLNGNK